MNVISKNEVEGVAKVYIADLIDGLIEFVDVEPEMKGDCVRKWVIILSTQIGCPVKCLICDAGHEYVRDLTAKEMLSEIEYIVSSRRFDTAKINKFKIQFARMGEPALNDCVIEALDELYKLHPNVIPCVSTIAPEGRDKWFENLLHIKEHYNDFQLQFSIMSTDEIKRDEIIRYPKKRFKWINEYGARFAAKSKRKPVLNFPLNSEFSIDPEILREEFDPEKFILKLTPVNPTDTAKKYRMYQDSSLQSIDTALSSIAEGLNKSGFEVIISIGDLNENIALSNCGQSVLKLLDKGLYA
ncbi:TPA: radical SAM protein [candidate division WOR-3 bacterium]|uniref:Radical SAM protein n=1 Tax=candidate division WOR-3 bacterium TaxID=2052148 RepID=A0A350HB19_UNCW3|nr:radical SAM protein [candidate division WOR-3 bacterium]